MMLAVNLSLWERLLKRDLNITSTSTPWKTAQSSPTPSTRLWLFFASPKQNVYMDNASLKKKKNLNLFFSIKKINRKSHILCVVFFQLLLGIGNFNLPMS